jgi:tetratricopeptide (TPR) repeat protein
VSTLVPFPSAPIADRFMYVPLIGLWLALADQAQRAARDRRGRRAALVVSGAVLLALAALTSLRNRDWRDDVALFGSAARVDPRSATARFNLGLALAERGDVPSARAEWLRAVALEPAHVDSLVQLGVLEAEQGRLPEARRWFGRALAAAPADAEANFNMALLLERSGQPTVAVDHYRRFLSVAGAQRGDLVPRVRVRIEQLGTATEVR